MILFLICFLLLWLALTYNRFQKAKQLVESGWSDIDVQLKKKYDLIPNLVALVKAYAKHEHTIFTETAELRTKALTTANIEEKANVDTTLENLITKIFAIAENYPKLEASKNFLTLQKQMVEIENTIAFARRYYNGAVRDFNILITSFPANILASILGEQKKVFFQKETE